MTLRSDQARDLHEIIWIPRALPNYLAPRPYFGHAFSRTYTYCTVIVLVK